MTEYIEKQAAISLPVLPKEHREYPTFNLDDVYVKGWNDALEFVEKIPPADVRPVVRCRDCKHSEQWYGNKSRCFMWSVSGIDVFNDGFCDYGVKSEES